MDFSSPFLGKKKPSSCVGHALASNPTTRTLRIVCVNAIEDTNLFVNLVSNLPVEYLCVVLYRDSMNPRSFAVLFALLLLLNSGCDKGLTPDPSGFSGVVRFRNWPPPDSVWELRIVAFKNPPADSSSLFAEFFKGNVLVYPPIGTTAFKKTDSTGLRFVDSISYTVVLHGIPVDEPRSYSYIALAWRYTQNILTDWRPAGIYTLQAGTFVPSQLVIPKHEFITRVNIECDFSNPPPRPWR